MPWFLGNIEEGTAHLSKAQLWKDFTYNFRIQKLQTAEAYPGTAQKPRKLIDFGCSCFREFVHEESETKACIVQDRYMPPELGVAKNVFPTFATDMWRVGCTLYLMLMQCPPFHDDSQTTAGIQARQQGRFYKPAGFSAPFACRICCQACCSTCTLLVAAVFSRGFRPKCRFQSQITASLAL